MGLKKKILAALKKKKTINNRPLSNKRSNKTRALKKKKTKVCSSYTIPPDIITDILYRLPAKSVGRFRCVSKDWLSLLSSPEFIKTHQKTINRNHLILVSYANSSLYSLPLDHHETTPTQIPPKYPLDGFFTPYGCCNGLVFGTSVSVSATYSTAEFRYRCNLVIRNPTTSEYTGLPYSGYDSGLEMIDNSEGYIVYGFGYDSVTHDYKVVTFYYFNYPPLNMYTLVYSLRTNSWTCTDSPYYQHSYCPKKSKGVFVNGFLHWFTIKDSGHLAKIIAFSLSNEIFNQVLLPDVDIVSKNDNVELVDLGGKLGIFTNSKSKGEVWLMNEYGLKESWTKITLHGLEEYHRSFQPMIFYDNGKILLVGNNQMLIYDIVGGRPLSKNVISRNLELTIKVSCIESLVSPNVIRMT